MKSKNSYKLGIDVGSTTVKVACIDEQNQVCFSAYKRHLAGIDNSLKSILDEVQGQLGDCKISVVITGSVGMGLAESLKIPFLQEVVAASEVVNSKYPDAKALIDIGGEDAKLVTFLKGKAPMMRMNGSCAGGTGAFIDQMASILGRSVSELNKLAHHSTTRHSISSRCGVFAKTDIQNLISKNVEIEDIAASIFHALAHQTVTTLVRGLKLEPKVLLCGGPFTYISYLQKAFTEVLNLQPVDIIIPENSAIIPALGCAITKDVDRQYIALSDFIKKLENKPRQNQNIETDTLPAIFDSEEDFSEWKKRKQCNFVERIDFRNLTNEHCFLGIDSGSTTTKIVLVNEDNKLLYSYYAKNNGNSLKAINIGLSKCLEMASKFGKKIRIRKSCVTGYGEDLVRKAYQLDFGIVETIAHYMGAVKYNPGVSFILDIGGQDMKAIFIEDGVIKRMEINEACSSGCGSFIESFANSMNYSVEAFAQFACLAKNPCDLGTRCTVFMNSKVKQFLRTNSEVGDISAGLSYSVVKNMLYKVLKIKDMDELGKHISVQGGTFKNLSVVKAMENITGCDVSFTDIPELMGALGCALYAREHDDEDDYKSRELSDLCQEINYSTKQIQCNGCENKCQVMVYQFKNSGKYFSGHKCERVFTNQGTKIEMGTNNSSWRESITFQKLPPKGQQTIGIPRVLNMFENFPFWNTLFTSSGFDVVLSEPSSFQSYEQSTCTIMSDNICFPAKLAHSHVEDLKIKKVDRIFMPYVIYEEQEDENVVNSYNCPIVSGYSDVIKSALNISIPVDSPSISFKDKDLLKNACFKYLSAIEAKLSGKKMNAAFRKALEAQKAFTQKLKAKAQEIYEKAVKNNRMVILLAGRPYHHDSLIQHKISDAICSFGVDVITDDIVRYEDSLLSKSQGSVMQWQYPNRIIKAAHWVAKSKENVHFVQLSSFGCGPDAFIIDEVSDILKRSNKNHTVLKIDDVTNQGSLRLRIRSLIESLKLRKPVEIATKVKEKDRAIFGKDHKHKTILIPYFSDFYSPFIPEILKMAGYKSENLPPSDTLSRQFGLKYINNEVCFPATVIVGDVIKALKSGKYDLDNIAIGMSQTGGQCRATNYISQIKKAMDAAGFNNVPVISATAGASIMNEQPGFKINWKKVGNKTLNAILFSDGISKLYYAASPREMIPGKSAELKKFYIEKCSSLLENSNTKDILNLFQKAVDDFTKIIYQDKNIPRIGIVGEIFVKYNSQTNYHSIKWIQEQGVEVVVPPLLDFGTQNFVNLRVNAENDTKKKSGYLFSKILKIIHKIADTRIALFNNIGKKFPYFIPFTDIKDEAEKASKIVNLSGQFGEGWLIPAEFSFFAENNINHAVCLQPFGCIANHVIAKGIENRVLELYPEMNLLFLDFDNDVSQANLHNRLHFMVKNAKNGCLEIC